MTDEEIARSLKFAATIRGKAKLVGKDLPAHLATQEQDLIKERDRRLTCIDGEGI